MHLFLALATIVGLGWAFQCSPDTILRMATDKRLKQLERDCHLAKIGEAECENKKEVEAAWKDFTKLSDQYRNAVRQCRETAARSQGTHRVPGPSPDAPQLSSLRKAHTDSVHPPRIGSARHHRKRHTFREDVKEASISEQALPESEQFDRPHPIRTKRQLCKTKASEDLNHLKQDFITHCDRENICLPDEDLPAGQQRERFKELHSSRAKKYSAYLTQLSLCYGRLT